MNNLKVLKISSKPYQYHENSKWLVDASVDHNGEISNTHFFCDTFESAKSIKIGIVDTEWSMLQPTN